MGGGELKLEKNRMLLKKIVTDEHAALCLTGAAIAVPRVSPPVRAPRGIKARTGVWQRSVDGMTDR